MIALTCFSKMREPMTRSATLRSSRTFQLTNSSMSGWSASSTTIFAARRVVPPDLIAPAARSKTLRNDMKPELGAAAGEFFAGRAELREVRAASREPPLKIRASRITPSKIPPSLTRSSSIERM